MGGGATAECIGGEFLMADYLVTDTELTGIANAIRTKGGTSAQLAFPTGFVSAIGAIPAGGIPPISGSLEAAEDTQTLVISAPSGVDFTDYDSFIIAVCPEGGAGGYISEVAAFAVCLFGGEDTYPAGVYASVDGVYADLTGQVSATIAQNVITIVCDVPFINGTARYVVWKS